MKKIFGYIGYTFFTAAIIFMFVHNFLVTGSRDEDFARDLFGLPIPHPPEWTSFIPVVGSFLDTLFGLFSLHGLVGIIGISVLGSIGYYFVKLSDEKQDNSILILGEKIDPDNHPKLYRWAQINPDTLESQLISIANAWHSGNVHSAIVAFESDLEHG